MRVRPLTVYDGRVGFDGMEMRVFISQAEVLGIQLAEPTNIRALSKALLNDMRLDVVRMQTDPVWRNVAKILAGLAGIIAAADATLDAD